MFESPVQSGLLTLRAMDRDRDRSTITIKGQKTGLDRLRPVFWSFLVFGPVFDQKFKIQLNLIEIRYMSDNINYRKQSYV